MMSATKQGEQLVEGLALEYQGLYGTASGNVDVSYFINNPAANGICRVFGAFLQEEVRDIRLLELRALTDDRANPLFRSLPTAQPFSKRLPF